MGKKRNKMLISKMKNKKKSNKKLSRNKLKNQLSIIQRNVEDEFKNENLNDYKVILDQQQLYKYLNSSNIQALDTESDVMGSEPDPIDDKLVGFSLFNREVNKPVYVPLRHKKTHLINFDYKFNYKNQLTLEQVKEVFKTTDNEFVFHNAKYDIRVFLNYMNYFDKSSALWDTYLASMYLNENERHGLKTLYSKYLGKEESSNFKDLFNDVDFSYVPIDLGRLYGGKDAKITFELYEFQKNFLHPESESVKPSLKRAGQLFLNTEMPLVEVLVNMEERGIKIDKQYAKDLSIEYHEKINKVDKKIQDYIDGLDFSNVSEKKMSKVDNPLNLNSPKQLQIVIYDIMGLNHPEGNTGKATLKDLKKKTSGEQREFFENLLMHRKLDKLIGTYIDKMPKIAKKDGKIHTDFNQYGAKTGRISSSNPNLQNIPKSEKKIRRMFSADKGKILLASDYSQQEPRILAHLSQDEGMMRAYKEGKDLYSWVASIVYDVPYETCTKGHKNQQYRTNLKSVILGLMYGRGVNSISKQLCISYDDAEKTVNQFFDRFPGIKQTIKRVKMKCKKEGYVQTVLGRKRRIPELQLPDYELFGGSEEYRHSFLNRLKQASYRKEIEKIKQKARSKGIIKVKDNGGIKAHAERQTLNSIIQGSASDMTKRAMILVEGINNNNELKELGYELLLQVHDEVIGQIPKEPVENVKKAIEIVEELMEEAGSFVDVPMKVDTEIQERWNGKEIEL